METPSSTRRVTRSQTLSAMNSCGRTVPSSSKKVDDDSGKSEMESRQRRDKERSALIDITNDSPIVGVAMQTPSSGMATAKMKKNRRIKRTPGSGEALLRGQVKTLLQKVEEEAVLTKISTVPFHRHLVSCSPMGLAAPTPANTPQLPSSDIVIGSPVVEEGHVISSLPDHHQEDEGVLLGGICEGLKSLNITRSLLLDFSDKSESSSSSLESSAVTRTGEEDSPSVWSMLVNAGTTDEDEDEQGDEEKGGEEKRMVEFEGKHTRFVYGSDGEEMIVEEQNLGVLRLKGLPTPMGKHFRFDEEQDSS